ncbi:TIGR03826 family flagellar region protein [Clostridiisalibacter paucivorans]|uniref:TIGR03826 family flagellar region protein n=1 Tax=Clostridiisalibacter paucivorans TaxID=408753 RepID=UPI00047994F2|nr:TIGR03826 family flagellar region protein [Clostridiisalibacter paucivorans]
MDVRNCRKCGKIYQYDGFKICPTCRKEDEIDFQKVKDYLYDNPNATIQMVSEETEVSEKKILRYLKEGRLELKDGSKNLILECERCGVSIKTGRFCDKCAVEIERELKSSISPKRDSHKAGNERMHIADRHKK